MVLIIKSTVPVCTWGGMALCKYSRPIPRNRAGLLLHQLHVSMVLFFNRLVTPRCQKASYSSSGVWQCWSHASMRRFTLMRSKILCTFATRHTLPRIYYRYNEEHLTILLFCLVLINNNSCFVMCVCVCFKMEAKVLKTLDFEMTIPTAQLFISRFLKVVSLLTFRVSVCIGMPFLSF